MYVRRHQRGIGFMGWAAILLLVGAAGVVAMRVVPPYAEYGTLVTVMESIQEDPSLHGQPITEIRQKLNTRLRLNEVDKIGDGLRAKDIIDIDRPGGDLSLAVSYQVEKPLIANAYILLKFDKRVGP